MTVRKLRYYLNSICNHGHSSKMPFFVDEDGDWQTIESVYMDDEGDIILDSEGDDDFYDSVGKLLHRLSEFDGDDNVYTCDCDGDYTNIIGRWYINDAGNVCIKVECIYDDDDDDDDWSFQNWHHNDHRRSRRRQAPREEKFVYIPSDPDEMRRRIRENGKKIFAQWEKEIEETGSLM